MPEPLDCYFPSQFSSCETVIMWLRLEGKAEILITVNKLSILHAQVPGVMILCTAVPFSTVNFVSRNLP